MVKLAGAAKTGPTFPGGGVALAARNPKPKLTWRRTSFSVKLRTREACTCDSLHACDEHNGHQIERALRWTNVLGHGHEVQ